MDFVTHGTNSESGIDTVRVLHQTIVSLRAALERSRGEVIELKSKKWSNNDVEHTIRNLSIENHILRQRVVKKELLEDENKQERNKCSNSKEKFQLEVKNDLPEGKRKEKKVKSNSKDKTRVTNLLPKQQKLLKYTEDNNVHISLDNNIPKQLKSSQKISPNQLSKSRIICFSHTFEDNTYISTINSLHINTLSQTANTKFNFSNPDLPSFRSEETVPETNSNTKSNIPIKHKKNIQFAVEPIDNVATSRQGSISEFITKEHKNQITPYAECVTKTENLLKNVQPELSKQFGKNNIDIDHKLKSKLPNIKGKGSKSVVLDEPSSFIEEYSGKQDILKISKQVGHKIEAENITNLEQNVEKDKNNTNEENIVRTVQSELQKLKNKLENNTLITDSTDEKDKCNTVTTVDITQIDKSLESYLDKGNLQSTVTKTSAIEDAKIRNNNLEEIKKDEQQNSIERNLNDTETSSTNETDNSSNAKHKNIEISVKIYKKIRKPIEIDIQTRKNKKKKLKMNDKSQNISFDKEYNESNSNQLQSVVINADNASADNIVGNILQNDVEQEVDDIELIFTTDDTKETDFKEELVPIDTYAETQLLQCPLSDYDEKLSIETSDRELEDDVFNDNFENENQENSNFQSQTYDFRRDNSQIYNSKSDNSINHEDKSFKSYYSYQDSSFENKSMEKDESFDRFEEKVRIIETDISKIGIQDVEYNSGRRNTCPNPIQYRPIIHREALGRGSRKCRPIVAHPNVIRKESGVQTDISALPGSSWRSESSLGHKVKVGDNFTTLPSKFPHPGSRLKLSEKTVEARRVLLSDIGFTSMVPELSRSADHLCPPTVRGPVVSYGQFLRTTDLYSPAYTSQKFVWTTTTPSDGSHLQSRYSSQYPLSSPPAPTRRCSAPVSPSKRTTVMKNTPSKVRFANASLPELRGDWTVTVDSGESTDSLVEEAEIFLRRSIDCLAPCRDVCFRSDNVKITGVRRASAPEPARDNVPPQGWQPFLPRISRDLHLDYWVKVISPEGRVRGGRVRYVGPLINQPEAFVGVQLSTPDGVSDGTYNSRRYFNCEPCHGLFVPFKKIIMGWRP